MGGPGKGKGGGGRGFGGSGKGKGKGRVEEGPPDSVVVMGEFMHPCEGDLIVKSTNEKVPYFNAPIFLENITQVGKVDEIFGTIQEVFFSVKPSEGVTATSFKVGNFAHTHPHRLPLRP